MTNKPFRITNKINDLLIIKRYKIMISKFIISLLAIAFYSGNAFSSCEFYTADGWSGAIWNVNLGNISVQRDLPVGGVIYTRSLTSGSNGRTILICTGTRENQSFNMLRGTPVPGFANVYSTNITGVGVRVTSSTGKAFTSPGNSWVFSSPFIQTETPFLLELIKTGDTGAGALTTGRLITWSTPKTSGGNLDVAYINITGGTIGTVACSVTNTAINVPMGDVPRRNFSGVGSAGLPTQFFVPLNCDAGTRVNITIDATADSSGTPGVMAIDSSSTGNAASGVGIRLTHNGPPVTFGTAINLFNSAPGGATWIPFSAQYYQTAPKVTAGQANATATFTMTYN